MERTVSLLEAERRPLARAPVLHLALSAGRPDGWVGRFPLMGIDRVALRRGPSPSVRRHVAQGVACLDIEIADSWLSSRHLELSPGPGGWQVRDLGSKNGSRMDGVPLGSAAEDLEEGAVIVAGGTLLVMRELELEARELVDLFRPAAELPTLSRDMQKLEERARSIAPSDLPIVLHGETGTGKEVLARAIHGASGRSGELVAVNCGALTENLVESALFGHRKGAFSGATADHLGLIRRADRGTLLLDEIAELPETTQVALLRVLQEREVLPVGGDRPVPIDVRVIAASHADLDDRVREGRFRQDLYMRLAGMTLEIPPIRDRIEDLGILAAACLRRRNAPVPTLRPEVCERLARYGWPGNVRELDQVLASSAQLADDGVVGIDHLPDRLRRSGPDAEQSLRTRLEASLKQHRGNVSAVARELGKARVQIRRWCQRLGIEVDSFRGPS